MSCDLPAKAMLQNFKGPVGKHACGFCHHPGVAVKNLKRKTTIRYVKIDELKSRTHDETVHNGSRIGFDVMHGVGLGIVKDVLQIWMAMKKIPDPKNNLKIKLKNQHERKCLNMRIMQLRPLMNFKRKPRTIFDLPNYKATELIHFLLFYFRFAVFGLLPTKVVKHLELLSAAIFILLKSSVNNSELEQATSMLNKFADGFEEIYGAGSITMNIHLLRHYAEMIHNCGPVWCNSLFAFESNIGTIKKLVSGTTDVLLQITEKYTAAKVLNESNVTINEGTISCHENIFQIRLIELNEHYKSVLTKHGLLLSNSEKMYIGQRFKFNNTTYTSLLAPEIS